MTRVKSLKPKAGYQHRQHRKVRKVKDKVIDVYNSIKKKDKKRLRKINV